MFRFRGKEFGGPATLADSCLKVIESGSPQDLYVILPLLRILRFPRATEPLLKLLREGNSRQQAAAALALGHLGDARCVGPLRTLYFELFGTGRTDLRKLQAAIITALGESGAPTAVEPLQEILRLESPADNFGRRRRRLVVSSLGLLAQQEAERAEEELEALLEHSDPKTRAQALHELSIAYWHRPARVPAALLQKMLGMALHDERRVSLAALAALSNLARLGCREAEGYFEPSGAV